MKKCKCPNCAKETISLNGKTKLLVGEEYLCVDCATPLKVDVVIRIFIILLMSILLPITFAMILFMFGFMVAVPGAIISSVIIYVLIASLVPVEILKKKNEWFL